MQIVNGNIFVTPRQAADILNVSLCTLKKFIYRGRIKTFKTPGGHHRINKTDLSLLIGNQLDSIATSPYPNAKTTIEIAKSLINALETGQIFCHGHASAVANISVKIAQKLYLSPEEIDTLYLAALMHDIGMLDIDKNILNKSASLTGEEYDIIKSHPLLGEKIIGSFNQFKDVPVIIRQHHERIDGNGYPYGLKNTEICREAKIIALAEAFNAMTAPNSYRKPLSKKAALIEIRKNSGLQFDSIIAEILYQII